MSEAGLTQVAAAEKAGVEQPVISRALGGLMGNAKIETLDAIAKAFGRDVVWLITNHDRVASPRPASVDDESALADRDLLDLMLLIRGKRDLIQRLLRMAKAGSRAASDNAKVARSRR